MSVTIMATLHTAVELCGVLRILLTLFPTLFVAFLASSSRAQGTFENLGFEAARIIYLPPNAPPFYNDAVATSNAIPGWTAYIGGVPNYWVWHDDMSLGAAAISIHDINGYQPVLQGNYSLLLQPSFPSGLVTAGIGQVGVVPSDAKSLRFTVYNAGFAVSFASQPLAITVLTRSAPYTYVLGADVSRFAGQSGELLFRGGGVIDGITFSSEQIPEPPICAIFLFGCLASLWCSLCKRGGES